MDYQIFLTYIVLALIVAITIHILFKAFYLCTNERFFDQNQTYSLKSVYDYDSDNDKIKQLNQLNKLTQLNDDLNSTISKDKNQITENKIPNNLMSEESKSLCYEYSDDHISGVSNHMPKFIGSTSCDTNNELIMDENTSCTKQELQKYRDDFFGFRSHLWQSSAGVDAVDRVNSKITEYKPGEKISNVYDSLTKNCTKKQCVMNQNLDNITMLPQYKLSGSSGDFYTKDNWVYNYDHVMNGALFYDNVTGNDPLMDSQMAVN